MGRLIDSIERISPFLDTAQYSRVACSSGVLERPEVLGAGPGTSQGSWLVTVYNNEYNTYQEVMAILIVATGCTTDEAYVETWEVDHLGSSVVHAGGREECERAAEVISTIGIRVEVTFED